MSSSFDTTMRVSSPATPTRMTTTPTRIRQAMSYLTTLLLVLYVLVALLGFASLDEPNDSIADPYFALMEVLILMLMPPLLLTMAFVHERTNNAWSLFALLLASLTAGITTCVHAVVLLVHVTDMTQFTTSSSLTTISSSSSSSSTENDFEIQERSPLATSQGAQQEEDTSRLSTTSDNQAMMMDFLVSFRWPSVVYLLDCIAWDWCFGLAMLSLAVAMPWGTRLERTIRVLLVLSGVLCLSALLALPYMSTHVHLRVVGIVGYALVPIFVYLLLGIWMGRTAVRPSMSVVTEARKHVDTTASTLPLILQMPTSPKRDMDVLPTAPNSPESKGIMEVEAEV